MYKDVQVSLVNVEPHVWCEAAGSESDISQDQQECDLMKEELQHRFSLPHFH